MIRCLSFFECYGSVVLDDMTSLCNVGEVLLFFRQSYLVSSIGHRDLGVRSDNFSQIVFGSFSNSITLLKMWAAD